MTTTHHPSEARMSTDLPTDPVTEPVVHVGTFAEVELS